MTPFVIRPHLGESTFASNIALNGVVTDEETPSVTGEIRWRWEDEPDMPPKLAGTVVAGHALNFPLDNKGRDVRFYLISKTTEGKRSVSLVEEAVQIVVPATGPPTLFDLVFDGIDEVAGDIDENGGTGTIHILRQLGSAEFGEIDSVPSGTTSFTDNPPIDGTYSYKLMQDGQAGESNTLSVVVSGVSGETGSPPSDLTGVFDGTETVDLDWTNNGGTGNNIVESKYGVSGSWVVADSVSSGTATAAINEPRGSYSRTMYYRVWNESVAGYSNEISVGIPKEF